MKIKFYGHSTFEIEDGGFKVLTDPHSEETGLKLPQLKVNAVTVSHKSPHHSNTDGVEAEKVFNWPGEFETAGVHFQGISSFHNAKEDTEQKPNTIFKMNIKGISICHLGDLGTKLTPEQLEKVGDVDILMVPVGGVDTIDAKKAKEVIEQIEPRIVIPMAYDTEGSKLGLNPVSAFQSEMGAQAVEALDVFTVKRSELPDDNSKVVILNQTQ